MTNNYDEKSQRYKDKLAELMRLKSSGNTMIFHNAEIIKSTYDEDTKTLKWVCPSCKTEYNIVHTGDRDIKKYKNSFRECSQCGNEYCVIVPRSVMADVFQQMIRKIHECGDPFG